jgi:predicted lipoprotein with Yx(FWY)xxD motif
MTQTLRPLFLLVAMLALIGACSGGGGASVAPSAAAPSAAPSDAPSDAPSEAPSDAPSASAGGDAAVEVTDNALGQILVDTDGMTLYGFTADTAGESTCYEQCATNWPPLLVDDAAAAVAGAGLDASLITTVERTDGTIQVKYGDWPLYYFANDAAAGDTNGQAVGDVWYVVDPAGELIGQ